MLSYKIEENYNVIRSLCVEFHYRMILLVTCESICVCYEININ